MSQDGELVFYKTDEPKDPRGMLAAVLDVCAPTGDFRLYRDPAPDRAWESFRAEMREPIPGVAIRVYGNEDLPESISYHADTEKALAAWHPEYVLTAADIPSDVATRVWEAVRNGVPKSIRGDFEPANLIVTLGRHDVFEVTEHEEGYLFAQPFLSIRFHGYGVPEDWEEARRQILDLSEVEKVRELFESGIGPLGQCVYWNG